jgi:hypothetical protein
MFDIEVESINLNGVSYLKETDVNSFYTRKDNVTVDQIVIENWLKYLLPERFVSLVADVANAQIKKYGYAELSDMIKSDDRDFIANKLLMIANADLI